MGPAGTGSSCGPGRFRHFKAFFEAASYTRRFPMPSAVARVLNDNY